MAVAFVLGLYLILSVTVVQGGEYCLVKDDTSLLGILPKSEWCDYGCCGDYLDGYCCGGDVAAVVWIVIGCLAGVAAIVTVICVICCCCCRTQRTGQVIGANSNTTATVVGVPMNVYSTPPGGVQYGQPMEYNNAAYPQMQAQAPPPMEQKKGQPPPSYDHVNPN